MSIVVEEFRTELADKASKEEISSMPIQDYLAMQPFIDSFTRYATIDRLARISTESVFQQRTLLRAINILDRFLSLRAVMLEQVGLVGVASLVVASRFVEMDRLETLYHLIELEGYCYEDVLSMEIFIFETIERPVIAFSPCHHIDRHFPLHSKDQGARNLAEYLLECTILDKHFIGVVPSLVAASASYLARHMLDLQVWVILY